MTEIFKKSKKFSEEYCCSIVKIGDCQPIKGKDAIWKTTINGETVVIPTSIKSGDIVFYSSNETQLNQSFLCVNNLFDSSNYKLNINHMDLQLLVYKKEELREKIDSGIDVTEDDIANYDETNKTIKKYCGFFGKNCRVRTVKLGGVGSMGFVFTKDLMINFCPEVRGVDLSQYVGVDFDMVNDELFVKAYVPEVRATQPTPIKTKDERHNALPSIKIPKNGFAYHYDTKPLPKCVSDLTPDTIIDCSVKLHGTSFGCGKILLDVPQRQNIFAKIWNKITRTLSLPYSWNIQPKYDKKYGNVTFSRTRVRYKSVEGVKSVPQNDIWTEYGRLIYPHLQEGMVVYGEIVGYMTGSSKFIQHGYDYGCAVGKNKLMPYRISVTNSDGTKTEWTVSEVRKWTEKLIDLCPDVADRLLPINVLYHGTIRGMYSEFDGDCKLLGVQGANIYLLNYLRGDKERLGMEQDEPMCDNKVPREGIVVRTDSSDELVAYKLKTEAFRKRELKDIDNGEVDIEMAEN